MDAFPANLRLLATHNILLEELNSRDFLWENDVLPNRMHVHLDMYLDEFLKYEFDMVFRLLSFSSSLVDVEIRFKTFPSKNQGISIRMCSFKPMAFEPSL